MGRGTTYYTIYHTGGKTHILAYSEYDAIEQFRKNYPNYAIKEIVEGVHWFKVQALRKIAEGLY